MDPWSQSVGQLFQRCAEMLPTKEEDPDKYAIDIARFEFALKLYEIPVSQWLEADYWMSVCVNALNTPRDPVPLHEDDDDED